MHPKSLQSWLTLWDPIHCSLPGFFIHWILQERVGEGNGTHSSTFAWKIPRTEEPGGLQSIGLLRVGHHWATSLSFLTFMHWRRKWQPTPVFLPGESQGAWWASICGVAQSWTRLQWLNSSNSQERLLEWVAMPSSRGSSWPKDQTHSQCLMSSALAGGFLTTSTTLRPLNTSRCVCMCVCVCVCVYVCMCVCVCVYDWLVLFGNA